MLCDLLLLSYPFLLPCLTRLPSNRCYADRFSLFLLRYRDALTVQLKDVSFPASRFFLHSGSFRKSWPRLNSGSSLKLQVLTQPKRAGELLVSPAAVSYKDGDLSRMTRIVADDVMVVEDRISYRRRTERHGKTWLIYIASCGTAAGVPFLLYYRAISSLMPTPSSKKRS